MGDSFDRASPIVHLEPTAKPLDYRQGRRWILWPVQAYRVYVPQPAPERLNLFQRSVLSLCRAGVTRATDIAERLALDRNLAAYVVSELMDMGLLDRRGELSARAFRLLDEERDDRFEPVAGYVFANPFSGDLWPRFHRGSLPYTEGTIEGQRGTFEYGSAGNPRRETAHVIWPPPRRPLRPPNVRDIMRACSDAARASASHARSLGQEDDVSIPVGRAGSLRRHLGEVVLLDDTPEPVFVTTFVFVPRGVRATYWQVCDPFGLGPGGDIRRHIERLANDDSYTDLRTVIEQVTGEAFAVEDADILGIIRDQQKQASKEVERCTQLDREICREVWERLVQMESRHIEAKGVNDPSGTGRKHRQKALEGLVRRAYEAVEASLAFVVRTFPTEQAWECLSGSFEDNARLLASMARQMGFSDDPDLPCFDELLFIGAGAVKGVLLHTNRELIALVAGCLLSARDKPEHPLRRCAREFRELFRFLHRLKGLRDQVSHHGGGELGEDDALSVVADTYRVARFMLPTGDGVPSEAGERSRADSDGQSNSEDADDVFYKLRAQATVSVESELGIRVRDVPAMRDAFIETEYAALQIQRLIKAGAKPAEIGDRAKDLLIACGSAVEASVKPLLADLDVGDALSDDRRENALKYQEAVARLGFETDGNGRLHENLVMVRPDRARTAAATRNGALNALLLVAALQAERDEKHPLRDIVRHCPEFFFLAGEISWARGHGDRAAEGTTGIDKHANSVRAIGRAVVEVLT